MPPYNLDLHFFQLTQAIFYSWFLWPHQKFLIILSKSLHRVFGSRKQLIVYMGTACAMILIRTSLPPMERRFSFHPTSFLFAFFFFSKDLCFWFPYDGGQPQILTMPRSCIGPRMSRVLSFKSWGVFGLKNTEDLSMLIFWAWGFFTSMEDQL